MNTTCPKCGAALQPNAMFCPHCMTTLVEKTELPAPKPKKSKRKRLLSLACIVSATLLVAAGVFSLFFWKKTSSEPLPFCSVAQFSEAAPRVSQTMGIDSLWDLDSMLDTHYFESTHIRQYAIDTALENTLFSLFFYNEGEEVYAHICDVLEADLDDAKSLLKCVVQATCNYYFTDIDRIFDDENRYPRTESPVSFDTMYTDMLGRTAAYNAAMENGTEISSRFLSMQSEEALVVFIVTTRNTNGTVLYDLTVEMERMAE